MMKRYNKAKKSFDEPVLIVTQAEAEAAEKKRSKKTKTWKLYAENVRDFAVASTLKSYSRMTFDYPYHKAISVHAKQQGMEYPMICWNYGRPDKEGNYSDRTKYGMMSVIIHEVGHNFFPMIVNSKLNILRVVVQQLKL